MKDLTPIPGEVTEDGEVLASGVKGELGCGRVKKEKARRA